MTQTDIQNAITPAATQIAQENTDAGLSTTARLDQQNQLANQKITAALNARGMLNSGETGYELGQENLSYRQAESDAYQKLLGYLQQYQNGYLSAQESRAEALAQAYDDAASRQFALWASMQTGGGGGGDGGDGGGGGGTAPPAAATPVYFNPTTGQTSTKAPLVKPGAPWVT